MTDSRPPVSVQRDFWDSWNRDHRTAGIDAFMARQLEVAQRWRPDSRSRPLRTLEIGCGTGWLCSPFLAHGTVTGIDLSAAAIEAAKRSYPQAEFLCAEFESFVRPAAFDYVLSADVIAHLFDHAAFVNNVASLLVPGGRFLLMTQNPFVWNRSSSLQPRREGQIRNWPSLSELRALLARDFAIEHVSSIVPGGDRGLLAICNHKLTRAVLGKLLGWDRTTRLYERILIGRELIVVARRLS